MIRISKEKRRKPEKRPWIQLATTCLTNGYIVGFLKGRIFSGRTKMLCVPGLNCYSCPGAMGSCPIGALQAVLGDRKYGFSFYVFGLLIFFGSVLGRGVCGFLCPFGFVQDLLHKIPIRKKKVPAKVDGWLRWLKYFILMIFVVFLPLTATNAFGMGSPYFCKWICPAGTLEGGIPLIMINENLRQTLGCLFNWKLLVLVAVLVSSVLVYRPFCKYLCPLGAFYSLFNRISLVRMTVDRKKCVNCGKCQASCGMGVEVLKNANSLECIRCGKCIKACSQGAISTKFCSIRHNHSSEVKK